MSVLFRVASDPMICPAEEPGSFLSGRELWMTLVCLQGACGMEASVPGSQEWSLSESLQLRTSSLFFLSCFVLLRLC